MDEEEGHLELSNPPTHALPYTPAKAQVPEVNEIPVFTQPPGWVKLVRIREEGRVSAHGIDGHLLNSNVVIDLPSGLLSYSYSLSPSLHFLNALTTT